jgi:hypothetical protein
MGAAVIPAAAFYAGPATASLKEVIIFQSLDGGTPPLIERYQEELLRVAPFEEKRNPRRACGKSVVTYTINSSPLVRTPDLMSTF